LAPRKVQDGWLVYFFLSKSENVQRLIFSLICLEK
jgi:hypothetical protein